MIKEFRIIEYPTLIFIDKEEKFFYINKHTVQSYTRYVDYKLSNFNNQQSLENLEKKYLIEDISNLSQILKSENPTTLYR